MCYRTYLQLIYLPFLPRATCHWKRRSGREGGGGGEPCPVKTIRTQFLSPLSVIKVLYWLFLAYKAFTSPKNKEKVSRTVFLSEPTEPGLRPWVLTIRNKAGELFQVDRWTENKTLSLSLRNRNLQMSHLWKMNSSRDIFSSYHQYHKLRSFLPQDKEIRRRIKIER